jgi:dephospho-CoA kinase
MRSEIARKILEETPPGTRAKMRDYGDIITTELTDEELREAIFEAKLKKWFHNKHRPYWEKQKGAYDGDKGPLTGSSF